MQEHIVLIETSWNVKNSETELVEFLKEVLIETSWNVKNSETELVEFLKEVLIETSWNVKSIASSAVSIATSINRNIVECKGQ